MIFLRNLLRAKVRNSLTVLGIAAGIAVFVSIASINREMNRQIGYITSAYNTEVMIKGGRALSPFRSRISPAQLAELRAAIGPGVSPMVMGTLALDRHTHIPVIGIPATLAGMVPMVNGRTFRADGAEVTAGLLAAELMQLESGRPARLGGQNHLVSGLYRSGSKFVDSGLMADIGTARRILGQAPGATDYNIVMVQTGNKAATERVLRQVRERFPHLRAEPTVEFSGTLHIFRTIENSSFAVAAIAVLGAAIVIANTLVMTVAERTRELGILVSIGWTPWLVLRMLFAESLVLCGLGALAGNLLAWGVLAAMAGTLPQGVGWTMPATLAGFAVLASCAAALVLALLALLWPAAVVYRLQPAQALRHD
jgi:ABC-type antimicrobial peptide transport system permease subunit